jgi:hypothetical protein
MVRSNRKIAKGDGRMLEAEIVHSMNKYLDCHGICYANEIRMGIGIPDISFNLGGNRRMKCLDDYYLFSVWDFIDLKKKTTLKEIKDKFLFTIERVKKYVFQLAGMNLVALNKEVVRVTNSIRNVRLGVTIAVEAKISDWKNGLIQAQRYLLFSDYSYLALPESNIKLVNLPLLKQTGIGLLAIGDSNLEEIVPATMSDECTYYMKYIHTSVLIDKYKKNHSKYVRKRDNIFSRFLLEDITE